LLFNSFAFLAFFPLVTLLFFALPGRGRWLWLLLASCGFYAYYKPAYLLILFAIIALDYAAGRALETARGQRGRRLLLALSVAANFGLLAFFKYYNFFSASFSDLSSWLGYPLALPYQGWLLPLGLSFHTFQSVSYLLEVYHRRFPAERHPGRLALYILYFPQLVAGPIERPQHLLPQLARPVQFDSQRVANGLKRMTWGFFKKLVVADNLMSVVLPHSQEPLTGLPLILMLLLFSEQLYCDFSGYTDIALGAAQVLGVQLSENFRRPYAARSLAEFWRRWHISLTRWFRLYLLPALSGRRPTPARLLGSVLLVFVLSGLWHGASWTFVAWGLLHGLYLVLGTLLKPLRHWAVRVSGLGRWPRLHALVQVLTTLALVDFAWLFCLSPSWSRTWFWATHLLSNLPAQLVAVASNHVARKQLLYLGLSRSSFLSLLLLIAIVELMQWWQQPEGFQHLLQHQPRWLRWLIYYALVLSILFYGQFSSTPFIYFRF
jgi:alginate O-acetyltransferase complex protein AlgI